MCGAAAAAAAVMLWLAVVVPSAAAAATESCAAVRSVYRGQGFREAVPQEPISGTGQWSLVCVCVWVRLSLGSCLVSTVYSALFLPIPFYVLPLPSVSYSPSSLLSPRSVSHFVSSLFSRPFPSIFSPFSSLFHFPSLLHSVSFPSSLSPFHLLLVRPPLELFPTSAHSRLFSPHLPFHTPFPLFPFCQTSLCRLLVFSPFCLLSLFCLIPHRQLAPSVSSTQPLSPSQVTQPPSFHSFITTYAGLV